jgi:hypothetical protein
MSMAADVVAKVHSLQHSLDVANRTIAAQARANAETLEQCERIVEASRRACSLHTDAEEKWQQEVGTGQLAGQKKEKLCPSACLLHAAHRTGCW